MPESLTEALREFAAALTQKFAALTPGDPEDQLKSPVESLLRAFAETESTKPLIVKGESSISGIGRPDMAVLMGQNLVGHVELKAPGKGADAPRFRKSDHDGKQWLRFSDLPNLVYTDGESWALYRSGQRERDIVRLSGDPSRDGARAVGPDDAARLLSLLADFLSWDAERIVPKRPRQLAPFLAPYTRLLRDAVTDALELSGEIAGIRRLLKTQLFPDATDAQFADAYAQTILFGLLLARAEGADVTDLSAAYQAIDSEQTLLDDILKGLTDTDARKELGPALEVAQRVIASIPPDLMATEEDGDDPWLFFYEDFLAAYDPRLRKEAGAYYTPVQVVRCQVSLIDDVLRRELRRNEGLGDAGVSVLDPAAGTGTYPLAILDLVGERATQWGPGAIGQAIGSLVQRLFAFEIMVGPYAVSQLRLAQSIRTHKASVPADGVGAYLTNTLENPTAPPPDLPLWGMQKQIARQHARAMTVKNERRILVIVGNPPYGRHDKATATNQAVTGAWVRWGEDGKGTDAILNDFTEPARKAGHGKHLKNLYNMYVYFIRWAVWKAFEHGDAYEGPGIVSFITASSYLDGDAFSGLREHLRRECDEVRILDLGGEGRGTHQEENVFDIQTPVAIFVAWRRAVPKRDTPACVRYARIAGSRDEKFTQLDALRKEADVEWEDVPEDWQAPFTPAATGAFASWPLLKDLMPWQNNGIQLKRTWPIGPAAGVLARRWDALLHADDRATAMKDTGDRSPDRVVSCLSNSQTPMAAVSTLSVDTVHEDIVRYGFRSFDRQCLLADNRLISRPRLPLWSSHGGRQVYLSTVFTTPLGPGPALTAAANIPDLHHFRGSYGAADQFPLFRDRDAATPNLLPGLLAMLEAALGTTVTPEDFAGYLYGVLAHPAYQACHEEDLMAKDIRVPLTRDGELFRRASDIGRRLLWLQTYGERFADEFGELPRGQAQCKREVSGTGADYPNAFSYDETTQDIIIGETEQAGRFGPVSRDLWDFEVSGFKPVQSWLGYRMRERKGKKSSPLDDIGPTEWTFDFTKEFLQLLWVLEHTLAGYPEQAELLAAIESGPVFRADGLPDVPSAARKPPKVPKRKHSAQQEMEGLAQ